MEELIEVRVLNSVKGHETGDIIKIKSKDLALLASYVEAIPAEPEPEPEPEKKEEVSPIPEIAVPVPVETVPVKPKVKFTAKKKK